MAQDGLPAETDPAPTEMDSVQAGARWLMGAAAAVLAVLVAGLQLSELADVASAGPAELAWVVTLCLIGLTAISTILVLAARVLIHPGWTLNSIAHRQSRNPEEWGRFWLSKELDARRGFIMPDTVEAPAQEEPTPPDTGAQIGDIASRAALNTSRLYRHQHQLIRAWFELLERGRTSVTGDLVHEESTHVTVYRLKMPDDVNALEQRLQNTSTAAARIANLANMLDTRRRYQRLVSRYLPGLGAAAVLSVLGLIGFLALESEVSVSSAVQVDVRFTGDDAILTEHKIPPACKNRTVRGVAINGSLNTPVVVSNDGQCSIPQLEIAPELGTVVPVLPPSNATPATPTPSR